MNSLMSQFRTLAMVLTQFKIMTQNLKTVLLPLTLAMITSFSMTIMILASVRLMAPSLLILTETTQTPRLTKKA